jgi:hypothetical protein
MFKFKNFKKVIKIAKLAGLSRHPVDPPSIIQDVGETLKPLLRKNFFAFCHVSSQP